MPRAYTPGPWRIGNAGVTLFGPKSEEPAPITIANRLAPSPRCSREERIANLRLMSKSPELLEALIEAHAGAHDDNGGGIHCPTCALIESAGG